MALKVFLDTNVILDNLAERDTYAESLQLLDFCESGELDGVVSTVSVMDALYILRKYLPPAEIRAAMRKLLQIVDVFPAQKADIVAALDGEFSDLEDAVQASCAARAKADYIVTRNVRDFSRATTPVVSPADMVKKMKA